MNFISSKRFWGLAAITLLGLWLRLWALDFGLPNDSRPDEIPILMTVIDRLLGPALVSGDWRLHPGVFNYGSLYFYLSAFFVWLYYLWGLAAQQFSGWGDAVIAYVNNPTPFHLILRGISAVAGAAMIPVMFLLGRSLYNHRTGWLSALLAATSYMLVRNAHFGAPDTLMTLGIIVTLWLLLRYDRDRRDKTLTFACIAAGLSISVKLPALILLMPIAVVLLKPRITTDYIHWPPFFRSFGVATSKVLGVFLLSSPWVLLDVSTFLANLQFEATHYFTPQLSRGTTGWVFYPAFALWYGLGWPVLALSALGIGHAAGDKTQRFRHWILWSFGIGFFILVLGPNLRVMTRYALPLAPILVVYAAIGLDYLATLIRGALSGSLKTSHVAVLCVIAAIILVPALQTTIRFDRLLAQPDTRSIARQWLLKNTSPSQPVAAGPHLGHIRLPGNYGLLLFKSGPPAMTPPTRIETMDLTGILDPFARLRLINTYRDVNSLRQLGIRYVALYGGHPLFANPPWEHRFYGGNFKPVFAVSPLKDRVMFEDVGRYEPYDAFYVPYEGFELLERPGPVVTIYDLEAGLTRKI